MDLKALNIDQTRSLLLLFLVLSVIIGLVTTEESVLRLLRCSEGNSVDDKTIGKQQEDVLQERRTFGHKRIQFMMMPMIYKMGVMMTMIAVLTVISLKGLLIGIVLLILKLSTIFGKFFASLHGHASGSWTPQHQPIHLHLHNSGPYEVHGQSHGWETADGGPSESYYYRG